MGVAGSGKTTAGVLLADILGVPFLDADDYHSDENRAKMHSGIPLDDEARLPWLERLAGELEKCQLSDGCVLACSALKSAYRNILSSKSGAIFVYLKAGRELIRKRLSERAGHFMNSALLESQFETLEEPEDAVVCSAEESAGDVAEKAASEIMGILNGQ